MLLKTLQILSNRMSYIKWKMLSFCVVSIVPNIKFHRKSFNFLLFFTSLTRRLFTAEPQAGGASSRHPNKFRSIVHSYIGESSAGPNLSARFVTSSARKS